MMKRDSSVNCAIKEVIKTKKENSIASNVTKANRPKPQGPLQVTTALQVSNMESLPFPSSRGSLPYCC